MRRTFLVLGCGLLGVAMGGCGSSDDTIAKADGLCKSAQEKQLALLDGTSSNSKNPKVMKEYLQSSFSQTKELNDKLRALAPPTGKENQWKTWILTLDQQEKSEKLLVGTVKTGMQSGPRSPFLTAMNDAISQQLKRNQMANDLGLEACGRNTAI